MGRYLWCGGITGKADWLVANAGATEIHPPAAGAVTENDARDMAVICVVDNGFFDAAGWAYSEAELEAFTRPDSRPRRWLTMPAVNALALVEGP